MIANLGQLFLHSIGHNKPDHLLVQQDGKFAPVSSAEFYRRVLRLHLALARLGLRKGDRCGLLGENRWEWAAADFAMMTAGIVSVPLYPTLTGEQIHYMLADSEARAIFVSTVAQKEKVVAICGRLPALEKIICFEEREFAEWIGAGPVSEAERRQFQAAIDGLRPEDLASIMYTSGTTGVPKGVMLTHSNLVSNVNDTEPDLSRDDVCLSFLPLSHIYERMVDYSYYLHGATVAHVGVVEQVPAALLEVRPTQAACVPRFFEKMHGRIMDMVSTASPIRRRLFHWALGIGSQSTPYRLKNRPMPFGLRVQLALADKLVFSKIRARLGGRIKQFISGSAPLPRHLAEFFYAVRIPVLEGYGLTETSPVISANKIESIRFGAVGKPIRNLQVRIAEDGEILVRGPNVMRGYYKMERETAEVMEGGWFHTGDIGKLDPDGYLTILDRKKDLLKTSGGKYIAPQPIENKLKSNPYIADAVVIADQRRFPSALIVPNFARLEQFAREQGITAPSQAELVRKPQVVSWIEKQVEDACGDLASYEKVKKVALLERDFSIAEGEITPTLKVRRREVERRYREVIDSIYEEVVS